MKNLAEEFLSNEERERITKQVMGAEKSTSGEIVPMVVSMSHDYPRARLIASFIYSLPLTLLLTHLLSSMLWRDPLNVFFFFSLQFPLLLLLHWLLSNYPLLYKPFITQAEMLIEVEEEAIKSFFSERLYATRGSNGILLFISVFERRAWILADHGIDEKIAPTTWQRIIDDLTTAIGEKRQGDGICNAIETVGDILKDHFPYQRDDQDELHNLIIR